MAKSTSEGQKPSITLGELIKLTKDKPDVPNNSGLGQGDQGDDVSRLQAYLAKFGYLASSTLDTFGVPGEKAAAASNPGNFDEATAQALRRFQEFNHVPITGELDEDTVALM